MKKFILAACLLLLPVLAHAQTVRGPVTAMFEFNHDGVLTDYYELCDTSATPLACERIPTTTDVPGTYKLEKVYNSGPFTVAVRACNAHSCSGLSNTRLTPIVVTSSPSSPTQLIIIVTVPQGD